MAITKVNNLVEWGKAVKQRDGNICRRCEISWNLHAHHILPKATYPEFELELNNGVTLCGNCHSLLAGKEEQVNMREFLSRDPEIDGQLELIVQLLNSRFESMRTDLVEAVDKLTKESCKFAMSDRAIKLVDIVSRKTNKCNQYKTAMSNLCCTVDQERKENSIVISQIRSLYRDENDLFRTVVKRIYEQWNRNLQQWDLLKIEFIYEAPDYPLRSDNTAPETVEERHGWVIPPAWEFRSEVWEYERKPIDGDQREDSGTF